MSNFDKSIVVVLAHEGGYVNHPNDPGGETNYGITKRSYPNVDIKNLTLAQAKEIYKRDFWNPGPYEKIENDDIATKLFDTAVNVGPKRAYRFLQKSLNLMGMKLLEDGIIGSKTLTALNSVDSSKLLSVYRGVQSDYYKSLVAADPKLAVFLRGWLRRAES